MPESFSSKLENAFQQSGQLCVGIDPHEDLLVDNGFDVSPNGLREFSKRLLDSLDGVVSIVKPQVSFYERFGSAGFQVLEEVLLKANQMGFVVIADAKRGDIGSTMSAYTSAWLNKDAPFMCDALTLSPYLGVGSLIESFAVASERGKGIFVLAATSNREGESIQRASLGGTSVAEGVLREIAELNAQIAQSKTKFGTLGAVVGATVKLGDYGIDTINGSKDSLRTSVLAPGFGFQGAKLANAKTLFGFDSGDVIYTISRSALRDGIAGVSAAVKSDSAELAGSLG